MLKIMTDGAVVDGFTGQRLEIHASDVTVRNSTIDCT